jgi:hypothetical protein
MICHQVLLFHANRVATISGGAVGAALASGGANLGALPGALRNAAKQTTGLGLGLGAVGGDSPSSSTKVKPADAPDASDATAP